LQERPPARLLKCDDPARPNDLRNGSQDRIRVAKKHEDVTTHHRVEGPLKRESSDIRLREVNMFKAEFHGASGCARDGSRVAFGADDFAGGPDNSTCDQRNVPYSGSEIENTLPGA
jgi:hypothetical protein